MGNGKRRKAPGNDLLALRTAQQQQRPRSPTRADATAGSTPGRGEAGSPWLQQQQLMAKVPHRPAGNGARGSTRHHLPTITRGPQALRQMHHHGSSPLQRTPANQAAVARIEFLSQIATWAASNKILPLGAFYGERLASACQAAGIPSPVLNSQCEQCESVLLPGVNYSVRSGSKSKKKKKGLGFRRNAGEDMETVNTVVHRCSYCKYGNQKVVNLKDVGAKLAEEAAQAQMKDEASSRPSASGLDQATPVNRTRLVKASAEGSLSGPVALAASETVVLSPASVLHVDLSASNSDKKRKRKGWSGLKAASTNPERAGFK